MKTVNIIGSGFSGLSSAAYLAKKGYKVKVFEKNDSIGGRARVFEQNGFLFDMGPSWYWMPEVFERFYNNFGHTASDFYELKRLNPSYRVWFGKDDYSDIPANKEDLLSLFDSFEENGGKKLELFLADAAYKYESAMKNLVYLPGQSFTELLNMDVLKGILKTSLFSSVKKTIDASFKSERATKILGFPVLFLGGTPANIPSLYTMMNHADLELGTWYPIGGMGKIVNAFEQICKEQGVQIITNSPVDKIIKSEEGFYRLESSKKKYNSDAVVSSADYAHTESVLLKSNERNYDENYWKRKVFAPSCLIFYLGVNRKLPNLKHHNLFFDEELDAHAKEIYETKKWPEKPLFYVCAPSRTDSTVAPEGMENLFVLMPAPIGIKDDEEIRDKYFDIIMNRLENITGEKVREHIVYKKSYAQSNFISDYNSYRGNAYGLANTLMQTAFLKPSLRNKKLDKLFYTGQLTVPGPGVPPAIISGEIVANEVHKTLKKTL